MPLRGGSRSIPRKNLRPIAGRPLFAWSLEQVIDSGCFEQVCVSTDDREIRQAVTMAFGEKVAFAERSHITATDTASTESVMLEVQERIDFDVMCLVQATSPLTLAEDFQAARQRFESGVFDSLVTAVEQKRFLWSRDGTPINYDPRSRPRRQEFEGTFVENGAFYFTRARILRELRCRVGGRICIHPMAAEHFLELDEAADWERVEQLLLRRKRQSARSVLERTRALIVDVDGTLTDGGMYYGPDGESLKKFNTRDAKGLERLRDNGIRVCVVSAENSPAVAARMHKLGISDYHSGVRDKAALMERLARSWDLGLADIAYIGDDLGDLECLQRAGFSFCPSDAVPEVLQAVDRICTRPGGRGAVREVCDLILESQAGQRRLNPPPDALPKRRSVRSPRAK
ncbi:MAG: cytidylyltransferase domain-containing protein [Gammaproteobacteria bacterium]